MKGVSYLIDDEGNKTHIVLELSVWQSTWKTLLEAEVSPRVRQPGSLKQAFEAAGVAPEAVGDVLLEPMSEEELKAWYDSPVFDETPP